MAVPPRRAATPAFELRPAREHECAALGELALRSKAWWGYDEAFLAACAAELAVTAAVLADTVVAGSDDALAGFHTTAVHAPGTAELLALFVAPEFIGAGVGAALFADACRHARALGCNSLRIEADPGAEPFYARQGARTVGRVPSGSIAGRELPLMVLVLH